MPYSKYNFRPGINKEGTDYSNEGGWFNGDKIRFRAGYAERIGGWTRVSNTQVTGTPRKIFDFVTLASQNLLFIGTEKKVLLENAGTFNNKDIANQATEVFKTENPSKKFNDIKKAGFVSTTETVKQLASLANDKFNQAVSHLGLNASEKRNLRNVVSEQACIQKKVFTKKLNPNEVVKMSDKFVNRQMKNVKGKCFIDETKHKASNI